MNVIIFLNAEDTFMISNDENIPSDKKISLGED